MEKKWFALWLCAFCLGVFILELIPGFTSLFVLDSQAYSQPWRFLSAIFLHGSLLHLMYNLFALALFGSILEHIIGSRRFLVLFLAAGILANILAVFFYPSSLGASGAIFGVLGALVVLRPGMIVWAFSLPMPMFLAGIIWAIGDLIGLFIPSDVGHIAHLAGMGIGIIYGFFVRGRFKEFRRSSRSFVLDERAMRDWEDNYMR